MESGPDVMRRYRTLRDGMTQEALARRVGVSLASVQAAEQGKYTPKLANVRAYDEALDAGGAIIAAFGYAVNGAAAPVSRSEFQELLDQVRGLAQVVDRIERRLREGGLFEHTPPGGRDRPSA